MNQIKTVPIRSVIIPRFIHVVDAGSENYIRVQASSDSGKLQLFDTTQPIYRQVLGSISGADQQLRQLGLRGLTHVKFRGHLDAANTLVAIDIVPKRAFVRGSAPVSYGQALTKGFEMTWDEDLQGFDVRAGVYAGMDEKTLFNLLDELRDYVWKNRKSAVIQNHKVERDGGTYTVKPTAAKQSFVDPR